MRPKSDVDGLRSPIFTGVHSIALAVGAALMLMGLGFVEADVDTLPFVIVCWCALIGTIALLSRRMLFSVLTASGLMALSTVASIAKFKWMTINAHVFDLWFYVARWETFVFLAQSFPRLLIAAVLVGIAAVTGLALVWTMERPRRGVRRRGAVVLALGAVGLPLTLPHDAGDFNYHIEDRHFVSSFFASFVDLTRLGEDTPVSRPAAAAPSFSLPRLCSDHKQRPDIVLTLSESAVPPEQIPGWKFDAALSERFKSFDGRTHRARVETHAGGTWISYASMLSGLSMADFGWKRPYATMLLRDGLHHTLPAALARCGYRTVALSPGWFRFVNEGPFLLSMGFSDYLDAKTLGAPTAHEMDAFYFDKAIELYKKHIEDDGRPLFLFVMSTVAHSPYTYRAGPGRIVRGEPFGNDAPTDEYLRRLTLAQDDYATYLTNIRQLGRRVLTAQFGDHHPIITRSALARAGVAHDAADWAGPLYETFYAVTPINTVAAIPLPDVAVLDVAFLGVTLLETAGLPLDPVFADKRDLREHCKGAFHTCADRAAVDLHLARLRNSGLLGRIKPEEDIRFGSVTLP